MVPGNGLPSSSVSSGLGSSRSTWLGPPCMNSEIIAFAFGAKCGFFGVRSKCAAPARACRARRAAVLVQQPGEGDGADAEVLVARKWRRENIIWPWLGSRCRLRFSDQSKYRNRLLLNSAWQQRGQQSLRSSSHARSASGSAGAGSFANAAVVPSRRTPRSSRSVLRRSLAAIGQHARRDPPARRIGPGVLANPLREGLRLLHHERAVHQHQRLRRRRRAVAGLAVRLDGRPVEGVQDRQRLRPAHLDVDAAARLLARRDHDLARESARGVAVRLADDDDPGVVLHHRHRRAERLRVQLAADGEDRVADRLGFEAAQREAAEQAVVGVDLFQFRPALRGLADTRSR